MGTLIDILLGFLLFMFTAISLTMVCGWLILQFVGLKKEEDNGLTLDWGGNVVFMNPPYGRDIKLWIRKAYQESKKDCLVVCLIPARTDTSYWHDYIFPYAGIEFLRGRLKFEVNGIAKDPAPFPSAIVVFGTRDI